MPTTPNLRLRRTAFLQNQLAYQRHRIEVAKGRKPACGLGCSHWGDEVVSKARAEFDAMLAELRALPPISFPDLGSGFQQRSAA